VITNLHDSKSKSKVREERRKESRNPVSECGVIKTVAGMAVAELLDVSRSGLRVTAPGPSPIDAQIDVLFEDVTISGTVRNCVRSDSNQFRVGIGNARSSSRSPRIYVATPTVLTR